MRFHVRMVLLGKIYHLDAISRRTLRMFKMYIILLLLLPVLLKLVLELGTINLVIFPFTSRDLALHHHIDLPPSQSHQTMRSCATHLFERSSQCLGDHKVNKEPRDNSTPEVDPANHRSEVHTIGIIQVRQSKCNSPSGSVPS
jgi:hypothetical protein